MTHSELTKQAESHRAAMIAAITQADAAGIDPETIDRMRLACEYITNPAFRKSVAQQCWDATSRKASHLP